MRMKPPPPAARFTSALTLAILLAGSLAPDLIHAQARPDESQSPANPDIPTGAVLVEGDILVPEAFARMRGTYTTQIWTGGVIPYEFDAAVTTTNRARALLAMADWEPLADIQFTPRAGHTNYVYIQNGTANNSYVGMVGGLQVMNIRDWDRHFVIVHELGHALGLWHEQSRTDRDQYVRIESANIRPGTETNFQVQPASTHFGPYDFDSVMHYNRCAFSTCCPLDTTCNCPAACQTITVLPPNEAWQDQIGAFDNISNGDAATVEWIYSNPADCNSNHVADGFDIANGTSGDCNTNDIPDECELYTIPPQVEYGPFFCPLNGHSYLMTTAMTWAQAETIGVAMGGHLATIRNAEENSWLVQTFADLGIYPIVHFGFNDIQNEGTWVWVSGEPVQYTNWGHDEPNNFGNEDIGVFVLWFGGFEPGDWNDDHTSTRYQAIIEVNSSGDCNNNTILDECDIASGISHDVNSNAIPDECEPSCDPPTITRQPVSQAACEFDAVTLLLLAQGDPPPSYQWRKDGIGLPGATGVALTLAPARPADSGAYDVVVSNACDFIVSDAATVVVWPTATADANGDGAVNGSDIAAFIEVLLTGEGDAATLAACAADLNGDGRATTADVSPLVARLLAP